MPLKWKLDTSQELFEFLKNANEADYTIMSNNNDDMTDHSIVCNQNVSIDNQSGMYKIYNILLCTFVS